MSAVRDCLYFNSGMSGCRSPITTPLEVPFTLNVPGENGIWNQPSLLSLFTVSRGGWRRGGLCFPNSTRLRMRSLNCVPEDMSCGWAHAVVAFLLWIKRLQPRERYENELRNLLFDFAWCQVSLVLILYIKVKLRRSLSHAACIWPLSLKCLR